MTELTDSSPSVPPPSVLCGSGILSCLDSPWFIASSGHFDPGQTYDGYKEVEVLDPACTKFLAKGKDCFQHFNPKSSKCHFCFFGKKPCCYPGSAAFNIRRMALLVRSSQLLMLLQDILIAEGCGKMDQFWRVYSMEVVDNPVVQQSSTSPSQPPPKRFQSRLIPSTPRNFQPTFSAIPTSLPHSSSSSSHTRPAINPEVRPSPIQKSRASPIVTSQKLQPEASSSRRREELSTLPFPDAQVFQQRDCWPIRVTREDPNTACENQYSVARLFRRVHRKSREVIMYANDRTIPGTASEEMAENFAWYEDELIIWVEITSFLFLVCVWFYFYPHSYSY
ncbi:hypothetical protein O181_100406 [Austropuccinia psidii MF-1]|uniref:Uncharacterized protein n=1 Tax=Austropuccinia psidii MF-1 TaxID=1389203 RepID=A0A9Q3PHS2_9BASI|nr:hypothetical protein [Austropuccinia psidii MF-1]